MAPRDSTGPACLINQYRCTFTRPGPAGAAAPHVPSALIQQLAPGGRLVIPVGAEHTNQELRAVDKDADGRAWHTYRPPDTARHVIDTHFEISFFI